MSRAPRSKKQNNLLVAPKQSKQLNISGISGGKTQEALNCMEVAGGKRLANAASPKSLMDAPDALSESASSSAPIYKVEDLRREENAALKDAKSLVTMQDKLESHDFIRRGLSQARSLSMTMAASLVEMSVLATPVETNLYMSRTSSISMASEQSVTAIATTNVLLPNKFTNKISDNITTVLCNVQLLPNKLLLERPELLSQDNKDTDHWIITANTTEQMSPCNQEVSMSGIPPGEGGGDNGGENDFVKAPGDMVCCLLSARGGSWDTHKFVLKTDIHTKTNDDENKSDVNNSTMYQFSC
ncbi:hypothetical protein NDU88_011521 [Pleurodeles waltl]|uniref:Uncharacterized protein n=1 Tax=Pleurodeles waltl TaxID=8319 RepID=A0AAV7S6F8_PLEWA|nr:hypothetical protein NDU88_011521 [Pleurodeles waltl]